ncbi:glycosyl transferase family 2 [Gramella sp. Hel_I_59]|uniref:glycosyltransferase n=1 Tax=Gramella sp. Hel_I_59 TaxID=1249978 RepID=UPI00114F1C2A|nr:glycosyltransferase [Gramella sp. Hel_I_59]TQI71544.1 glycosyl transferase family 2 [Gramella sp. Hel_I_59]
MRKTRVSIIICSRSRNISFELELNIRETAGFEYDLIVLDNSKNDLSIFQAYNQGIEKSKAEVICFVHEDVLFHTKNWVSILVDLFERDENLGIIGIAGSQIKTKSPSGWWNCPEPYRSANLIQHLDQGRKEHWNYGFNDKKLSQMVVVDGVFMALRRNSEIRFNEALSGFHHYDLSICLDYSRIGYDIMVTNQILIEHFSLGNLDRNWSKSAIEFEKIYSKSLPVRTHEISEKALDRLEYANRFIFIEKLLSYKMFDLAFEQWMKLIQIKPLSRQNFLILKSIFK